jgi:class 3 adenylate cyclase/tetratricopeptide (TPR) repeat protein
MLTCATCGDHNGDDARFCNRCGNKLQTGSAIEQRRVCTIVFCDLVGFTARSERLDPEDIRRFLLPYYELMEGEITGHGGTIDKLYGDGAMAVFGAQVAHEDDPERAIRASLNVLQRLPDLGLNLEARIGIDTGEVVVSLDHAKRGDSLTGDTVNTASRLQSIAPSGSVVVGERTHAATADVFEYETLEPVTLKGKTGKVPAFRPLAPIVPVGGGLAPDATPFVGRVRELARLSDTFEEVRRGDRPAFVTIVAEPGIGKSRLVRQFARSLDDRSEPVTWRQGRCLPYGDGISFWPLSEIVKSHADILDSDDQETVAAKLDSVLTEPDAALRRWMKDRLAPLVGLEATTEAPERDELFTAWLRFLQEMAQPAPTVLVVEDLHWADDAMVAFLSFLRDSMVAGSLLVLATARPEIDERYPGWVEATSAVPLAPLEPAAVRELIGATLGDGSPALAERVLERAGGSPLYVEQFAAMRRTMPIAGGSEDDLPIPPTIQALLTARIDMLPPDQKSVLQDASVIGKTFWGGAVVAIGDVDAATLRQRLERLVARELVRRETASSIGGEDEFSFVHALVHDVAYAELSRQSRLHKHRAAARWIAETTGSPLGELADIVVSHLDQARDAATAAGVTDEVVAIETALIDPLREAAEHATRVDMAGAAARLSRVLDLLSEDDPRRTTTLCSLATAVGASGDFHRAAPLCEEAMRTARASGDRATFGEAVNAYVGILEGLGEDPRAMLEAARDESRDDGATAGSLIVVTNLALYEAGYGTMERTLAYIQEASEIIDTIGATTPSRLLEAEGMVRLDQGDPAGEALMRTAFDQAVEEGAIEDAAWVLNDTAVNLTWLSGFEASLEAIIQSRSFARERGLDPSLGVDYLLQFKYELGRWDEVLDEAPSLSDEMVRLGADHGVFAITAVLTRIYIDRGGRWLDEIDRSSLHDPTPGSSRQSRAALLLALTRSPEVWAIEPFEERVADGGTAYPSDLEIQILCDAGRPDLAKALYERWPQEFHATVAYRYTIARAVLALELDGPEVAHPLLLEAVQQVRRLGARRTEAALLARLGRCERALGRSEDARSSLHASMDLWTSMGADARVDEVAEQLATT